MATKKTQLTNIKLEHAYNQISELKKGISKAEFANIINTNRQNLFGRTKNDGVLNFDELILLKIYLDDEKLTDNDFYNELKQEMQITDFADIPIRGEVGLSCGYGSIVYNDTITDTCKVPRATLRQYGANIKSTEIVYAQGDSMSPDIESGDALLVDTSQTEIINGVCYAFNYDGQPMCKRLQKIDNKIKAISKNTLYDPFFIDKDLQFNIVGRVVGIMRPIL